MSKHFRPDKVVRISMSRGERRRVRRAFEVPLGGDRLSGTTVGVVIAVAVCAGLAVGLGSEPTARGQSRPDKPILWDETQDAPRTETAPEDKAWATRAEQGTVTDGIPEGAGEGERQVAGFHFGYCHSGGGRNCVVDGDTFHLNGDKVRIAGIDAPETHPSRCAEEARLGEAATHRLRDLLNSGAVSMSRIDRDRDVYGRQLRNVAVGGSDVGAALIGEGLARDYAGGRRSWCA